MITSIIFLICYLFTRKLVFLILSTIFSIVGLAFGFFGFSSSTPLDTDSPAYEMTGGYDYGFESGYSALSFFMLIFNIIFICLYIF